MPGITTASCVAACGARRLPFLEVLLRLCSPSGCDLLHLLVCLYFGPLGCVIPIALFLLSKTSLPRPSVVSSSICIHLWHHLFAGDATNCVVVLGDAMSHRILSQDQSPVCCAWPWNHGVRLRGVRLERSLASLRGLLRGLALSAGCAHCLGVRSTPLGSSLKAASLFYKASISPRFPTSG
ncbi:hypothetical protein V6N13_032104 [Hibiscus sabdariffa]